MSPSGSEPQQHLRRYQLELSVDTESSIDVSNNYRAITLDELIGLLSGAKKLEVSGFQY